MIWFVTLKAIAYLNWYFFSYIKSIFFILEDLNCGFLSPGTACFPEPLWRTSSRSSNSNEWCCQRLLSPKCLSLFQQMFNCLFRNHWAFHKCISFYQEYWWNGKTNPCWKFCPSLVRAVLWWSGSETPCCRLGFSNASGCMPSHSVISESLWPHEL